MKRLSRRNFLAASAAASAGSALAGPAGKAPAVSQEKASRAAPVDVVIVGAGAAGLAAARRLTAAGRTFALVEASPRVGGRCITDTTTFGVPYDRGAHWIHMPNINPVAKLAKGTGLDVYPA